MADLHCCTAEITQHCKAIFLQLKKKLIKGLPWWLNANAETQDRSLNPNDPRCSETTKPMFHNY